MERKTAKQMKTAEDGQPSSRRDLMVPLELSRNLSSSLLFIKDGIDILFRFVKEEDEVISQLMKRVTGEVENMTRTVYKISAPGDLLKPNGR